MSNPDPIHLRPPALAMEAEPLSESDITALLDDPTISVCDLVAGTADLEQENPAGHWRIGGPSEAEWAMRKYAEAAANLDLLNEQADAYITRIRDWHETAARQVQRTASFFGGHLEAYGIEARLASDGKVKSVSMPSGTVATTESQPKAAVADEEAVAEWAAVNLDSDELAELVKTTHKTLLKGLRAIVSVVPVPTDRATVSLSCGCGVITADVTDWTSLVGCHYPCDIHGDCLVEAVAPETQLGCVHPATGELVPGTVVDLGGITAKVRPS